MLHASKLYKLTYKVLIVQCNQLITRQKVKSITTNIIVYIWTILSKLLN
jgi:hypothetical protein